MKTYFTSTGVMYKMAQGKTGKWFGTINFVGHTSHFTTGETDEQKAKDRVERIVEERQAIRTGDNLR